MAVALNKIQWELIDSRVGKAQDRHKLKTKSTSFLFLVFNHMFPGKIDEFHEGLTDGGNDFGIDYIHIIEKENDVEMFIIQSKYRNNFENTNKTINDSEVLKVINFFYMIFDKNEDLINSGNIKLSENVKRIWSMHEAGLICRYSVVFCSNDSGLSESSKKIADAFSRENTSVSFEHFGPIDLVNAFHAEGRVQNTGNLQVIAKQILERSDGDIRGAVATVDAISFINLVTTENNSKIKRSIFDDNLRVFLGEKGGYNANIIETATSESSYIFWYLNNGVTITCKNFSYNKSHVNPVLNFEDFQIVNGAQTSHSLYAAFRENPEALEDVSLLVRIYATSRTDVAERVAVATNSQARIQARDLHANDQILKDWEILLLERGYYFERKRNMHVDKSEDKRIDALKIGQVILSFDLREPEKAKTESDSIFSSKFRYVFNNRREIESVIRLFELYRIIERKREEYDMEFGAAVESGHQYQYLIYGHWFVLYACRLLLAKKGLGEVPQGEEAEQLVEEAVQLVASACSQQKAVAHYQMFRSAKTKDRILAELNPKQQDFFELLAEF